MCSLVKKQTFFLCIELPWGIQPKSWMVPWQQITASAKLVKARGKISVTAFLAIQGCWAAARGMEAKWHLWGERAGDAGLPAGQVWPEGGRPHQTPHHHAAVRGRRRQPLRHRLWAHRLRVQDIPHQKTLLHRWLGFSSFSPLSHEASVILTQERLDDADHLSLTRHTQVIKCCRTFYFAMTYYE